MPRQTKDVVKPTLIDSFCFGLPPGVFLKRELTLSSERRIIAKRLFIMLMVISFVGATLHVQHELVQSVVIVLIYGQTMTNTVSGFASSLTLVKLSIIAALINIVTIVLWTDQPWFLLPWSFACLMVLLCHARINRLANILPLLFVMSVLYSPSHPGKSLGTAKA